MKKSATPHFHRARRGATAQPSERKRALPAVARGLGGVAPIKNEGDDHARILF
ncbi:MAG: hypothetical protein FWF81_07705 [Defluviitaleaceae bacterium]|nr:hypothetical protein [Defluviitaleaceae bacterium]